MLASYVPARCRPTWQGTVRDARITSARRLGCHSKRRPSCSHDDQVLHAAATNRCSRLSARSLHLDEVQAGVQGDGGHGAGVVVRQLHGPVPLAGIPVEQQPQGGSHHLLRPHMLSCNWMSQRALSCLHCRPGCRSNRALRATAELAVMCLESLQGPALVQQPSACLHAALAESPEALTGASLPLAPAEAPPGCWPCSSKCHRP